MLSLNELWFVLIAVLFIGFFFLEGFDFGVGMATRFLAKNEKERSILIQTIAPVWDANEVWMIAAGGAMFAAFPNWYATLFSGFYIPLVFMLLLLIGRGVAFEFRGKMTKNNWKNTWDWTLFISSMLTPFLWGVVFTAITQGVPIDAEMNMQGNMFSYLNGYTLLGGALLTILSLLHGLFFITLKTTGDLQNRARALAKIINFALLVLLILFVVMSYFNTDLFTVRGPIITIIYALVILSLIMAFFFIRQKRDGWSFTMTGLSLVLTVSSFFVGLFPRVMVSNINEAFHLTVYNASSSDYSLKVMTFVALTLLPFIIGYQIWSYYVFRKRISGKEHVHY